MAQRLNVGESSGILLPFKGYGMGAHDSLGVCPPFQSCGLQFINFKAYTVCGITVMEELRRAAPAFTQVLL